jgi:hypothetical protein
MRARIATTATTAAYGSDGDKQGAGPGDAEKQRRLAGTVPSPRSNMCDTGDDDPSYEHQSAKQVNKERGICHRRQPEAADPP